MSGRAGGTGRRVAGNSISADPLRGLSSRSFIINAVDTESLGVSVAGIAAPLAGNLDAGREGSSPGASSADDEVALQAFVIA